MHSARAYVLLLSVDLVAFYVFDYILPLTFHQVNKLLCQWITSVTRFVLLSAVGYWTRQSSNSVLRRWLVTHCFLGTVFETGHFVLLDSNSFKTSWGWLSCVLAGSFSCLFWEFSFPDQTDGSNGKQQKQKARVLLQRVILLYKPDYLPMMGACIFLSTAVLCEFSYRATLISPLK